MYGIKNRYKVTYPSRCVQDFIRKSYVINDMTRENALQGPNFLGAYNFLQSLSLNPHPNEIRNSTTEKIVTLYSVTMYKFEYFICNPSNPIFRLRRCAFGIIVPFSSIHNLIIISHAPRLRATLFSMHHPIEYSGLDL